VFCWSNPVSRIAQVRIRKRIPQFEFELSLLYSARRAALCQRKRHLIFSGVLPPAGRRWKKKQMKMSAEPFSKLGKIFGGITVFKTTPKKEP
jgi:hypothetical protein